MRELPRPGLERERRTGKSSMISEGSDATAFIIREEFEIEEGSTAAREAREDLLPAALLLVAVCKLDMDVLQRDCNKSATVIVVLN